MDVTQRAYEALVEDLDEEVKEAWEEIERRGDEFVFLMDFIISKGLAKDLMQYAISTPYLGTGFADYLDDEGALD